MKIDREELAKSPRFALIFYGSILIFWIVGYYNQEKKFKYKVNTYKCITKGTVKAIYSTGYPNYERRFSYQFMIYRDNIINYTPNNYHINPKILNQSFTVFYDCTDPSKNFMPVTKENFERAGWDFPDSLEWVEKK